MGCNEKNRCVSPVSSSCVMYVGTKLLSVDESKLKCGITITDVVETLDVEVNLLQKQLDNTKLQVKCFTFDRSKIQQHELNQLFIDTLCDVKKQLGTNGSINYTDLVSKVVLPINCSLTNCEGKNNKTLIELMQMYCTEIEALKRQIGLLQSQNNNSNTLYIPNV